MTYDEESEIAQQVLRRLAGAGAPGDARGARVLLAGVGYSVHRHGNDLRFNQQTDLRSGEVGSYLIVSVGEHAGGWMIARTVRPPGAYHDGRTAEVARRLVEHALVQLGYHVGTPGREGRQKTTQEIKADVQAFLNQPALGRAPPLSRRRVRRRSTLS